MNLEFCILVDFFVEFYIFKIGINEFIGLKNFIYLIKKFKKLIII